MTPHQISPAAHVDLTNCDREPIHLLGHIQPHGFLVAVSTDWLIQHVSSNVGDFVPCDVDALPGEPLSALLPGSAIQSIRGRLQVLTSNDGTERLLRLRSHRREPAVRRRRPRLRAIHHHRGGAGPDRSGDQSGRAGQDHDRTGPAQPGSRRALCRMRAPAPGGHGLRPRHALQVRRKRIRGRGLPNPPARASNLFSASHYPATDIPDAGARALCRNQTRSIFDVDAVPVPIVPPFSPEGLTIDLSLSVLRSVSPIHIEYLRNMGVAASFSVSDRDRRAALGLFAMHHYSARHLPDGDAGGERDLRAGCP